MISRGGFRRPFGTGAAIRDIIQAKGVTHLQQVASELRERFAIIPTVKGGIIADGMSKGLRGEELAEYIREEAKKRKIRVGKRYLPSRETIRVYIYMAHRLGLIEYTGVEGMAHRKDGVDAPDLAKRRYFSLTPGTEAMPSWENLWEAYDAVKGIERPKEELPEIIKEIIEKEEKAMPTVAPETALLREELKALGPLIKALPTTGSVLEEELKELLRKGKSVLRKEPQAKSVLLSIGQALEALDAISGRLAAGQEIEDLIDVISEAI